MKIITLITGLIFVILLTGCNSNPTITDTSKISFVTPTPPPPTPIATPRPNPTATLPPPTLVSTVVPNPKVEDLLLKAVQEQAKQNFSYSFEQLAELKSGNSITRLQAQGTGEVAQGNIRQSFKLTQSGQSQPIEQLYLDGQLYQKLENLKLWRKVSNTPKFASSLNSVNISQVSELKLLGKETLDSTDYTKISFKLPANLLYNGTGGVGLDGLGILNGAALWAAFAANANQPELELTLWLDAKGVIARHTSNITLNGRNTVLVIKNSYIITTINAATNVLMPPTDLPH